MTALSAQLTGMIDELKALSPSGSLCLDSRLVCVGDVFVACPGRSGDGRDFMAQAISRGAVAIIYEADASEAQRQGLANVAAFAIKGLRSQLGALASAWWGNPSAALTIIAITGTNGKTTTAYWIAAALRQQGQRCGGMGTLGVMDAHGQLSCPTLTTPDVISVHRQLAHFLQQGITHVVMEASSIGLEQGRLDGVEIDIAVYTNLTQDHLDYHGDMAAYAKAKALLFSRAELKTAVINADDAYAEVMRLSTKAQVLRYSSASRDADLFATAAQTQDGQRLDMTIAAAALAVSTPFVGQHTLANLLAVAGVMHALGWQAAQIAQALEHLPAVPGRLEPVVPIRAEQAGPSVIVDYAHTPDALKNVLQALKPLAQARGGKLWCVVGCGGNRDPHKRAPMAQIAAMSADHVVLTSDNPRQENPLDILAQMLQALTDRSNVTVQANRAVAILSSIWRADTRDVIVLAGKGHEQYQEIDGIKHPFDDRQWARLGLLFAHEVPVVQTDSRQLASGALFVALKGERFDGHDYLDTARKAGAVAAIVQNPKPEITGLPQIALGPTLPALQTLAMAWRGHCQLPVIGITGSNGKTTTKEMTAAICQAWVGAKDVLSTVGNLNNEIGVPLTLLRLRPHHRVAVIEMGMNHPGEIALLASIAQPTVALVLNAQREHQEFMQSVRAVAQENGQALCALPANGVAVFPAGDTYSDLWAELSAQAARQLTFGQSNQAQVSIEKCRTDALGSQFVLSVSGQRIEVELPVAGHHNVLNASAAAACAIAAGAPLAAVAQGLASFKAVKGRMQVHRLASGQIIIDDTYNANPDSVRAAIDVLRDLPAPRALVLGDMGEVGEQGPQMHAEVGLYAQEQSIEHLWALGQASVDSVEAFGQRGCWFDSVQSLCEHARQIHPSSILVKGSRFMAMERVVEQCLSAGPSSSQSQGVGHAC